MDKIKTKSFIEVSATEVKRLASEFLNNLPERRHSFTIFLSVEDLDSIT